MDHRRRAVVIWSALCVAAGSFLIVATVLNVGKREDVLYPMLAMAAGLTVFNLVGAQIVTRRMERGPNVTREDLAVQRHIVTCALYEGAALFACVALLITKSPLAGAIAVVNLGALLISYPGEERWQKLLGPPAEGDDPSRRT